MSRQTVEVARSDLAPIEPLFRAGRFVAAITCDGCGARDEWSALNMPRPDVVRKKIEARDWSLRKGATCPDCLAKSKEKTLTVVKIADAKPSDNAKVAERLLIRVMEDEAYDETARRYKPGFSDARMAADTGLSEKHVAAVRERLFGPAGEPDEVTELRRAIDGLTSELGKLRSRFDTMCAKNGFKQG